MNLPPEPEPEGPTADTIGGRPGHALPPSEGPVAQSHDTAERWRHRLHVLFRLGLVLLSVGGVAAALSYFLAGQGVQAARLLAADVLLIFIILLVR